MLNTRQVDEFGSQDFQRGKLQSAQLGLHAPLTALKEQEENIDGYGRLEDPCF